MALHTTLYRRVTDPDLRLATLLGLLSVPITGALSWGTVPDERVVAGGTLSGAALVVVGLLVGYLYYDRPTDRRRAGIRAGLAASLAVVPVYLATMVSTVESSSPTIAAVSVVVTPIGIAIGTGFVVLVVSVTAVVGDRLAAVRSWRAEVREPGRVRQQETDGSSWWLYVAVYVALVPVAAGYVFGIVPRDLGSGLVGALLVLLTTVVAALALVSVYRDAKRLYEDGSPWVPNVLAYVGVPVAAFVVGYYVTTLSAWEAPAAAVGQYSFIGVCWAVAVVYLVDRRRATTAA
ncbi:hypothetical protein SAMN04487949_2826 [Halogranum gelatinilyticum]|uniref:Uncharacterized protein n=1 Tax=Halogranum gelatinilyticum TaxID=660521 RepID=A0A1G9X4P2_9EURY|nr:DUF5518 domain-containing protein [Halogranum gelatinilyticum]SDM91323.1 hypothetical protein SAMN04487949_2826 [Halogranum gelatinilyticum]